MLEDGVSQRSKWIQRKLFPGGLKRGRITAGPLCLYILVEQDSIMSGLHTQLKEALLPLCNDPLPQSEAGSSEIELQTRIQSVWKPIWEEIQAASSTSAAAEKRVDIVRSVLELLGREIVLTPVVDGEVRLYCKQADISWSSRMRMILLDEPSSSELSATGWTLSSRCTKWYTQVYPMRRSSNPVPSLSLYWRTWSNCSRWRYGGIYGHTSRRGPRGSPR